jgi:small ligand-binding sensory domain FIST
MDSPDADWKVFIITSTSNTNVTFLSIFIEELQKKYPHSSIIGGVTGNRIGLSTNKLFSFLPPGHIAVIGLRGNVPLKAVVSRGMESISPECKANIILKQDGNITTGEFLDLQTNEIFNLYHHLQHYENAGKNTSEIMLGIRPDHHSAFSLKPFTLENEGVIFPCNDDEFEVAFNKNDHSNFMFQLFQLSPGACARDISTSLSLANTRFAAEGLAPMSCLLFTCSARGPQPDPDFFNGSHFCSICCLILREILK